MSSRSEKQTWWNNAKHNKRPIILTAFFLLSGVFLKDNYFGQIGAIIIVIGIIYGFIVHESKMLNLINALRHPNEVKDDISDENISNGGVPYNDEDENDRKKFNERRDKLSNKANRIVQNEKSKTEFTCNVLIVCFGTIVNGFNSEIYEFVLFLKSFIGNY